MNDELVLEFIFFKTGRGNEPVKKWLENKKEFNKDEEEIILANINTVCRDWELSLRTQLVKSLEPRLWEIRVRLRERIVRVFFTREGSLMVLLHGIVKKTREIPSKDLKTARKKRNLWLNG